MRAHAPYVRFSFTCRARLEGNIVLNLIELPPLAIPRKFQVDDRLTRLHAMHVHGMLQEHDRMLSEQFVFT